MDQPIVNHFHPITRPMATPSGAHPDGLGSFARLPKPGQWHLLPPINGRHFLVTIEGGVFIEISPAAEDALSGWAASQDVEQLPADIQAELIELVRIGAFDPSVGRSQARNCVSTLNINLCHECNIRCSYCFASGGSYTRRPAHLPVSLGRRAIELLLDQLSGDQCANVVFFGGEPLLAREVLMELVRYGRSAAIRREVSIVFDVFTNGTLIDEAFGRFVAECEDVRVLISLDGPPHINDPMRIGFGDNGVAATVRDNLSFLANVKRDRLVARATVASEIPELVERARYLSDIGLANVVFDPAFCRGGGRIPDASRIYDGITAELPEVADYLIAQIRNRSLANINVVSEAIAQILMNRPTAQSSYVPPCPAGRDYLAVDAGGDIYPCHYFVGHRRHRIGAVDSEGLAQRPMTEAPSFVPMSRGMCHECRACWLHNMCEGPCPYKRLVLYPGEAGTQDAHCRYMQARFVQALRVLATFYPFGRFPYAEEWRKLFGQK